MVDSSTPVWTPREGALAICGLKPEDDRDGNVMKVDAYTDSLNRHLMANKGIAYYRNEDLGHPDVGNVIALTFGTPEAQFEPEQYPDGPPKQMPDGLAKSITGGINWRYQLCAVTYPFPDIVEHHAEDNPERVSTQIWIAVDVAAEGPDGVVVLEQVLNSSSQIVGWRIINPANDEHAAEFSAIRDRLKTVFEEQGPMEELPLDINEPINEHPDREEHEHGQ